MIRRPDDYTSYLHNACQSCGAETPDGVTECARCTAYAVLLEIHDATEQLRGQTDEF